MNISTDPVVEEWRPIARYQGRYEISSLGRCRSIGPRGNGVKSPYLTKQGYHQFAFYHAYGCPPKNYHAHCLVAEAFIGPRPIGLFVCHNDGNPSNNNVTNLRYDTPKANSQDMVRHGRSAYGSRSTRATLTEAQVSEMIAYRLATGALISDVAKKFGTSKSNVQRILAGHGWKHLGFDPAADIKHKSENRSKKGEKGSKAKLKEADIHIIRREYAARKSLHRRVIFELAAQFGVSYPAILSVVRGTSWSHVPTQETGQALARERMRA